ncbi:MAG: damage-control phosphatase ARMT1 family protein, partial [Anaerolineaceae bacterium]
IHELLVWMEQLKSKGTPVKAMLGELLTHNLEGNRVDLSLWPVQDGQDQNPQRQTNGENPMLVNDLPEALDWIFSHPVRQVDLLMDNAGFEMLSDLCMLAFLLDQGVIEQAVLHVKPYPVFVSDVIEDDVYHSIHLLKGQMDKYPQLAALGEQLESHLSAGAIRIRRGGFWGLPFVFWEMDREVEENLSRADLIISKGDANYRRLVGDRRWDYQKPFSSVVSYMSAPLLAIRVIKSEPGAGYPLADFSRMTQTDPEWMRNGKWGSIQFWDGQQGV